MTWQEYIKCRERIALRVLGTAGSYKKGWDELISRYQQLASIYYGSID